MTFSALPCARLFIAAVFFALASLTPAQGQLMPGTGATAPEEKGGLETIIDEARKDGSTVIIVRPSDAAEQPSTKNSLLQTDIYIKARMRTREILSTAPSLVPNIAKSFAIASPNGNYLWLLKAFATAFAGLFVGWLVIRAIQKAGREYFAYMYTPNPETTADKAIYLLFRVVLALVYAAIFFVVAMGLAILFDPGDQPSRQIIFEVIAGYAAYRVLLRGVAWNYFAYDAPSHRVVNLTDDEAVALDRGWRIGTVAILIFVAISRFLIEMGEAQEYAGITFENVQLLQIYSATFITAVLAIYTLVYWKIWQHIFAPVNPLSPFFALGRGLAKLAPIAFIIYSAVALLTFTFKLALGQPAPGLVIAAPFLTVLLSMAAYGLVLIGIQFLYNRRIRKFEVLANAELERRRAEAAQLDEASGEEMISGADAEIFEYQPDFRPFFEKSALAIIVAVALRRLGIMWGFDVNAAGNLWGTGLNIALVSVIGWLAYRAFAAFIDKRMQQEGGIPDSTEHEIGGEGGGAGATRMATLLPILRWGMTFTLFAMTGMMILSMMGFDIGPIFAGAGVVGIAVGFGAQTLIRDIFSGGFFLMDDAFRRGEYIEIDGTRGTVEKISIRSFQLRHHLGALHTIPFGEIRQLTNYSRDWVMVKLPLRVTYDTDVEKVRKLVKKLGQELLQHPEIGHTFMEPLKSQGVYKMEDSAMIIRVKFMTKPGEQFVTRKVIYQSIQDLFAREGITFAHKEVTVRLADQHKDELTEDQKKAVASAARSVIDMEEEASGADGSGDR